MLPQALQALVEELARLPGVGPRTAERLAFYILRSNPQDSQKLAESLTDLHTQIISCAVCHNIGDQIECAICSNPRRETSLLAVVEDALDVIAIEKTGIYSGLYHVLGGALSPIDGIGPEQLNIRTLIKRVKDNTVKEIILATNPSTEGEATALYIQKQLPEKVKVTRLARGLPMGSDLEYADHITLGRAVEGRQAW